MLPVLLPCICRRIGRRGGRVPHTRAFQSAWLKAPVHKRRRAWALCARELGATTTALERACRAHHGWWGPVRRHPESPASAPAH